MHYYNVNIAALVDKNLYFIWLYVNIHFSISVIIWDTNNSAINSHCACHKNTRNRCSLLSTIISHISMSVCDGATYTIYNTSFHFVFDSTSHGMNNKSIKSWYVYSPKIYCGSTHNVFDRCGKQGFSKYFSRHPICGLWIDTQQSSGYTNQNRAIIPRHPSLMISQDAIKS